MIGLLFEKVHKRIICFALAVLIFIISAFYIDVLNVSAAGTPEVSVQIASAVDGTVSLESGTQSTALVFLDCSDYVFKVGSVKLSFDSTVFTEVSAKSDADIITKIDVGSDITTVKFSFDSESGLKGTLQLGTVSFKLKEIETVSVKSELKLSEIKFIDSNGTTHNDDFSAKNISVMITNKNITESIAPSATAGVPTALPEATLSDGSETGLSTPKPTNKTEILTDTAMYTLEDVEDLSNGAIVFWGLVFMVVGVWIGLGLGYWIWCKRKSKPQVKDTHGNVIGHLK